MKLVLMVLIVSSLTGCQEKKSTSTVHSSAIKSSSDIDLSLEKDESCDTAELTEDKIVEQAMEPAKANEAGALQGSTDCVVD